MTELWQQLTGSGSLWLKHAFLASILASGLLGIVGSYVVTRRITYLAGAIAHASLGGIGLALYASAVWQLSWLSPTQGALAAAIVAVILLAQAQRISKARTDSLIGAIWSTGMAIGLILIAKTPGYTDAMSYLFGNILLTTATDVRNVAILLLISVFAIVVLYDWLVATMFDSEFSQLRGLPTQWLNTAMLLLVAVTVVILIQIVGIILVIALLTLPAAIAGMITKRFATMMACASLFCILITISGLVISYDYALPTGPTIALVASCSFGAVAIGRAIKRKWGS